MVRAVWALAMLSFVMHGTVRAQVQAGDLAHGRLTVWVVRQATANERQRLALQRLAPYRTAPSTYVEKTASELGQSSSDFGQTAGSYGQTSGSFGTSASDTGQTAGSAGKNPSELGQTAGSYGQTAGSYGKTASEFGRSTTDINKPVAATVAPTEIAARELQTVLVREVGDRWPGLQLSVVQVVDEELKERLAAAVGTQQYPDVVVGTLPQPWWRESGVGLTMLGVTGGVGSDVARLLASHAQEAAVLRRASHRPQALAFLLWLRGDDGSISRASAALTDGLQEPVSVARQALAAVLSGAPLGAIADVQAASFNASLAQQAALRWDGVAGLGALQLQTDVVRAYGNRRFAVVALRTVVASGEAFGVVQAVVVLRRDALGAWKVLQVSPGLSLLQQTAAVERLASASAAEVVPVKALAPLGVALAPLGVTLASPVDGDVRSPQPGLWWDNLGGAVLQVVEWQQEMASGYTGSKLLLLSDDGSAHLQTGVTASFAREQARYRWRVWSLAHEGAAVFSPWRTFTVVGR